MGASPSALEQVQEDLALEGIISAYRRGRHGGHYRSNRYSLWGGVQRVIQLSRSPGLLPEELWFCSTCFSHPEMTGQPWASVSCLFLSWPRAIEADPRTHLGASSHPWGCIEAARDTRICLPLLLKQQQGPSLVVQRL